MIFLVVENLSLVLKESFELEPVFMKHYVPNICLPLPII